MRVLPFVMSLLTACTQVLGIDDFERTRGGNALESCGGLDTSTPTCAACMGGNDGCCAQAAACAADASCNATETCIAACDPGDLACIGTCNASIPYRTTAQRNLEQCLATKCADACELSGPRMLTSTRARCYVAQPSCSDIERQIWQSPAATAWAECQSQCRVFENPTQPLADADACGCVTNNPGSEALAEQETSCARTCLQVEPDWTCVGSVQWPTNNDNLVNGDSLRHQVSVRDTVSAAKLADVTVSVCSALDTTCATPLVPPQRTDAQGRASFEVPRRITGTPDYFGYLLLQSEGSADTLEYFFPPVRQSGTSSWVTVSDDLKEFFVASGGNPPPTLGSLGVGMLDCNDLAAAAGLQVTATPTTPATRVVYLRNGFPNAAATMTDESGYAGIFGLQPGVVHVTTTRADTGQRIGEYDVVIAADSYTVLMASPSP